MDFILPFVADGSLQPPSNLLPQRFRSYGVEKFTLLSATKLLIFLHFKNLTRYQLDLRLPSEGSALSS
jgi:hypothetical protein